MVSSSDTICAIASGMTTSGIGIIRISGPEAFRVLGRIFRFKNPDKKAENLKGNTVHYGYVTESGSGDIIDEALVIILRAPHSYTGEDTAEIDCHGGLFVLRQVLAAAVHAGARLAEPGEFTKRAFLNGRIDLTQAEAVMDVISASSDEALKQANAQLGGTLRKSITDIRGRILERTAFIEAALDDPEHYDLEAYGEELRPALANELAKLQKLSDSFREGAVIREGILTVILGKPNAGKSSLLNLLVGTDRAIVTDIAGTTGDTLEESVQLSGITLRIADTAGIRDTENAVEKIGVDRALALAEEAGLIFLVLDASAHLTAEDERLLSGIGNKRAIILVNKSDLPAVLTEEEIRRAIHQYMKKSGNTDDTDTAEPCMDAGKKETECLRDIYVNTAEDVVKTDVFSHPDEKSAEAADAIDQGSYAGIQDVKEQTVKSGFICSLNEKDTAEKRSGETIIPILQISALTGEGKETLAKTVRDMFLEGKIRADGEAQLTRERHKEAVDAAISSLRLVLDGIDAGMPEDLLAVDLMDACRYLGGIIGENADEDLIDTIFSKFCMGK